MRGGEAMVKGRVYGFAALTVWGAVGWGGVYGLELDADMVGIYASLEMECCVVFDVPESNE